MKKSKKVPEDIQKLLKQVYDTCSHEDVAVRERQIRQWRRLKLLWENFNRVWFSEVAHDWRIWDETADEDTDQAYYDKPINIFRAYLESIIAALSVLVPPVKCYPDDADNPLDLATARAGDKIGQLVYRHNDVPILWLHSLFIFVTEGMTAFYSYPVESEDYGTYEEKEYDEVEETHHVTTCPMCGHLIDDQTVEPNTPPPNQLPTMNLEAQSQDLNPMGLVQPNAKPTTTGPTRDAEEMRNQELDEFQPGNDDAELHYELYKGQDICPACMALMDPEISEKKFMVTRLVGVTTKPKTRICTEAYGGLYVKIGNYVKKQKDLPYLIYQREEDYSMVVEKYEHLHKNSALLKAMKSGNAGGYSQYEQWGRLSPQYQGEYPLNVVTINSAWIRPGRFNVLNDQNDIDKLKKLYPDGVKVVFVNEEFAEACNEALDDCWTLTENPMADYLHFDPLGQSLVSVQEITNDLISLILQTIEHGIGQTFADPGVLNFNAYEQTEALPGGMFPATPKSGKSLNDGFFELRTATLSQEVMPFSQQIQTFGQVVTGALPSLFGGQLEGAGGETASGYSMSRAQALQRLQNTWKLFTTTWKTLFGKVIPAFIQEVQDDERDVQMNDDGNFINVLIRKADLEGKIGKVELEANENLPMTWTQRKDLLMNLMTASNPKILEIINAPENLSILHEALGLVDFYVPGEDDIIKQYDEIKLLLNSTPIPQPPPPELIQQAAMAGMPPPPMQEVSSVPIDPDFDNNQIEFEIVRKWAISEAGREAKTSNADGYRNVLLHGKEHLQVIQQQQQQQMMQQAMMANVGKGAPSTEKPNVKKQEAPIQGENNVKTAQ